MSGAAAARSNEVSACYGKRPFATAAGAYDAMRRMVRRYSFDKREGKARRLTIYRCPHCHHHHIGSTAW